ncbi:hypothetical protein R3P38DRAFT_2786470 [Favolaschia claudopus]|uniref:Uncharacterized protein n=1 Tax=Favolaschia claudopus TaxID=2862362 RepID=A0AAW0ASS1_9AGAR
MPYTFACVNICQHFFLLPPFSSLTLPPMNPTSTPFLDTIEGDEINEGGAIVRHARRLSSFQLLALFGARLSRIQRPIRMQPTVQEGLEALAGIAGSGECLTHNAVVRLGSTPPVPHVPIRLFEDFAFNNESVFPALPIFP